jgi:multiple sugar transport system ATP-binding protein
MASVKFTDVEKRYGSVPVSQGLNLEVPDREFMVLVGPSGSGKSTALRMVAGLEDISGGTIEIGGRTVNQVPPKDRDIAMVFQNYALYPHMTVRENLDFGLRLRKTPSAEIERLVGETAAMLGISPLLGRRPRQLSGGERQRVAVGRAIMRKPAVFLFDEPLSNLDAKLRVQMRAEIKKIQQQVRTTTIYVTHDQIEAMTMGSRIAVMKDGRLQQVGTPMEIYHRPENLFVAGFIGPPPMTFVPAAVEDGGRRLVASGFSLEVPASLRSALARRDGGHVTIGLRPEDLRDPSLGGSPAEAARIPIRVEICEPLGHEVVIHGVSGRDPLVCVHGGFESLPEVGSRMEVVLDPRKAHLFDAETERRIEAETSSP